MLNIKNVEFNGMTFQLHPIDPFDCFRLDRKVIGLLGPILGPILTMATKNPDKEVDISGIVSTVAMHMNSMPDCEYLPMMEELFRSVVAVVPGQPALQLDSRQNIKTVFAGKGVMSMYRLLFEVVRFNKFLPFDLGDLLTAIGSGTPTIAGLSMPTTKTKD